MSERLLDRCLNDFQQGKVSTIAVNRLKRYSVADVSCLEPFLIHSDPDVRCNAILLYGSKGGDHSKLLSLMNEEKNSRVLISIMKQLEVGKIDLISLVDFIRHKDPNVKYQSIHMFQKAKQSKYLIELLFDNDSNMISWATEIMRKEEDDAGCTDK